MIRKRNQIDSRLFSGWGMIPKQLGYGLLVVIIVVTHILGVVPVRASSPAGLVQQGKIAYERGDFLTAQRIWAQAETTYRHKGDSLGVAGSQVNQAQALIGMGMYRRACKLLSGTVRVNENVCEATIPDQFGIRQTNLPPNLQALAIGLLGDILRLLGNLDAAQVTLATAGEITKPLQIEDRSPIFLSLGNTLRDLGNRDRHRTARLEILSSSLIICPNQPISNLTASEYYQHAIACYRQADNLTAHINLLDLQVEISDWLKGRDLTEHERNWQQEFNQSALINQIKQRLNSQPFTNEGLNERINFARSLAMAHQPQWTSARALLNTVITQGRLLNRKSVLASATGTLGWLYEQERQWTEAVKFTRQALSLTAPDDDTRYQWEWQLGRILQHQSQPDFRQSKAAYDRAVADLEQTRRNIQVINPDAQFSLRDRIEPLYHELVDLSLRLPQPNLPEIIERVDALKLAELENFLQCPLGEYRLVNEFAEDSSAVVFYPIILADRLEVILRLAKNKFQRFTVPISRSRLEVTISSFQHSLAQPQYGWDETSAAQLYDWLIRPAQTYLTPQTKNLVFVMDGVLQNIPVAALYDRSRGEYLIDRYPVAVTPGLKILGAKQSGADRANILIGGLTTTSASSDRNQRKQIYPPLTHAANEIQAIKSLFPQATELVGKNFTPENIRQMLATGDYGIIHLATHGQFSSDPRQNFIITESGKSIDFSQLRSLLRQNRSRSIDLLVLSACETATGDRLAGLGLAGTALRSGAGSTLASLWSVDDRATTKLMQKFYRTLTQRTRVSKAEALRAAQMATRQEYEHPYYWAPFVLLGNWL